MKKLTTILLALVMALALLPATVWAEGETGTAVAKTDDGATYATLVEAVKNVKSGGTVTLLRDFTGAGIGTFLKDTSKPDNIPAKSFTIDFDGFTYTVEDPASGSRTYETQGFHFGWSGDENNNHSVKLMNGRIEAAKNTQNVKMLIQNYCNLTLENITLDGTNLVASNVGYYTLSNCCGTVSIKNSTIIAHEGGVAFDVDGNRKAYNNSPVNVTVDGGSVIQGKIEVTDGNVLTIKDGAFTDLATAFKYAADKATIKLADNVKVDAQLEVAPGKDITLDLGGKTVEYAGAAVLTSGVIAVHNGAALTVTGEGAVKSGDNAYAAIAMTLPGDDDSKAAKLTVNSGTLEGKYYAIAGNGTRNNTETTVGGGKLLADLGAAIYHPQVGTLTVSGGELTGKLSAIEIRSGKLVIQGGIFTATATAAEVEANGNGTTTMGAAIAVAQHDTKNPIDVTITGGIFSGVRAFSEANPQKNDAESIKKVTLKITGGRFEGAIASEDVTGFITGGTFSSDPSAFAAEGFVATKDAEGAFTVAKPTPGKPGDDKPESPKTFDAGVAVYGMTAILSVTGMAWMGLKKRK